TARRGRDFPACVWLKVVGSLKPDFRNSGGREIDVTKQEKSRQSPDHRTDVAIFAYRKRRSLERIVPGCYCTRWM
ncbi:MAG TPA: hypothetical protein VIH97_04910, partial [Candidatus Acidoferrales bacterium]